MPAISSEIWGNKHLAEIYSAIALGLSIGSFTLATKVAGAMYDGALARHGISKHERDPLCPFADCYSYTCAICAAASLLALLLSLAAAWKTRGRYQKMYVD
jgi:hypothetical protein